MSSQIYSQPIATSTGSDARTNVIYAIERLKEKSPSSISSAELVAYVLPTHKREDAHQVALFKQFLKLNEKVNHDPKTDSYTFRPLHNIFTADHLLAYLQNQHTALGINVRELKDGWPTVEETIDKLERQHKLLVTRNKKDNHPRMVWSNDPTLIAPLDDEYREMWEKIPLPDQPTIVRELRMSQHEPVGDAADQTKVRPAEKKKKKVRRGVKLTNTHMVGTFRDYSQQRPHAG